MSALFGRIGDRLRRPDVVQFAGMMMMMPFMFLSSAFAPLETMPGWMQTMAAVNPVAHATDALRRRARHGHRRRHRHRPGRRVGAVGGRHRRPGPATAASVTSQWQRRRADVVMRSLDVMPAPVAITVIGSFGVVVDGVPTAARGRARRGAAALVTSSPSPPATVSIVSTRWICSVRRAATQTDARVTLDLYAQVVTDRRPAAAAAMGARFLDPAPRAWTRGGRRFRWMSRPAPDAARGL